jgi:hypothetical protein
MHAAGQQELPQVRYPRVDVGLDTLPARIKAQQETIQQFKVFYGFKFTDKLKESGITFVHHAVPESGMNYMRVLGVSKLFRLGFASKGYSFAMQST